MLFPLLLLVAASPASPFPAPGLAAPTAALQEPAPQEPAPQEPAAKEPAADDAPKTSPEEDRLAERMKGRKEGKPKPGWVVTSRYGFQMRNPKKWTQIAIQTTEEWLAAKFQCDREYLYNNKEIGFSVTHRPELLVIAFPKEVMKERGKDVKEVETEQGTKVVLVTFKNPYKDYDDFLDRTYNASGFYKLDEKTDEVNGIPVIKRVYKAEKLSYQGPKFIVTWLFQDEDVEYALQTEVMEDVWPKLQSLIEGTYKSFELIKRDGPITHDGSTQGDRIFTFRELNSGEPKERRSKRVESEKVNHDRAISKLPEGWRHEKKGDVMMLSNADERWTKRVHAHVTNMFDWLEGRFGFIGPGEYVRAPIVRVCRTSEEEQSFRRGVDTGGGWYWSTSDAEFVLSQDDSGWIGPEVDYLNRELIDYWMGEKNPELMRSMPNWLANGLDAAIQGARMDGAKPEFQRDHYELENYREAERAGTLTDPRALFVMTAEDFTNFSSGSAEGFFNRRTECQILVSFLISDASKGVRQAKGLLERYMTNLIAVIDEAESEYAGDLKKRLEVAEDEEEERKLMADIRNALTKRERTILERTFERTFGGWTDKDWEAFAKGMRASF
jgi:hypothetical protein